MPEGWAGTLGLHAMPAHAHSWWLIEKKGGEIMKEKVEEALKSIRPALQADGGDVELVDVIDGVVKVRLKGACGGCPMSQMTLTRGVEATIKKAIPEVKRVEAV
jgi:Fe-S cluster biogenesis protein NfuA